MARHVGYVEGSLNVPTVYQGVCRCGWKSPVTGSRADADTLLDQHLIEATRAQIHRQTRQPTLEDQAKWYRLMEADAVDQTERKMWANLAQELEHRLGADEHSQQPPLFTD